MNMRDEVVRQALSLDAEDRVFLADALEQSLTEGGFATAEIEAAWSAEIDRRIAAYDRGEVHAQDLETSLARIRQHLADHRSRKVAS